VVNERRKKQNRAINDYSAPQNTVVPESTTRHHLYLLNKISDQQLKNIAQECNKAIKATEDNNMILALFHSRKVIENILVYAIEANKFIPKKSYRSATNLKICRRNNFLDEDYVHSIEKAREICGDNTHQIGYEELLTSDQIQEVIEIICKVFDYVVDRYKPVYQA